MEEVRAVLVAVATTWSTTRAWSSLAWLAHDRAAMPCKDLIPTVALLSADGLVETIPLSAACRSCGAHGLAVRTTSRGQIMAAPWVTPTS